MADICPCPSFVLEGAQTSDMPIAGPISYPYSAPNLVFIQLHTTSNYTHIGAGCRRNQCPLERDTGKELKLGLLGIWIHIYVRLQLRRNMYEHTYIQTSIREGVLDS